MAKFTKGVSFTEKLRSGYDRVLTSEAVAFVTRLHRNFEDRRRALIKARAERQKLFDKGVLPDFLPETRAIRDGQMDGGADPGRSPGSAGRDHRADRPQDGHQRSQFRRQGLHDRFRGFEFADLGQHDPGPDQSHGPLGGQARFHRSADGQGLQARQEAGGASGAPARLASARAAHAGGRRACVGRPLRFRPVLLPQRQGGACQ